MKKFDNHIFMTICEVTLKLYKETRFSTHVNYCGHFSFLIKNNEVRGVYLNHINKITEVLSKIFGMTDDKISFYIYDYFTLNKCKIFENSVLLNNMLYSRYNTPI